jgi:hypothetical protein
MDVANIMQKTPPMANVSKHRQQVTRLTLEVPLARARVRNGKRRR